MSRCIAMIAATYLQHDSAPDLALYLASCCACVTYGAHKAALTTMTSDVNVLNLKKQKY